MYASLLAPRRLALIATLALAAALATLAAVPPERAHAADSNWYIEKFHITEHNAAGADGHGVRVAVIDGMIDPSVASLRGASVDRWNAPKCIDGAGRLADTGTGDDAFHATGMVSTIVGTGAGSPADGGGYRGVAPKASVWHGSEGSYAALKRFNPEDLKAYLGNLQTTCLGTDKLPADGFGGALDYAINTLHARIISLSIGVGGGTSSAAAQAYVEAAVQKGIVVVVATDDHPRNGQPTKFEGDIAALNGVLPVNAINPDGKLASYSVRSEFIGASSPGQGVTGYRPDGDHLRTVTGHDGGSSFATAWTSGVLADLASKYPKATGNQLLQAVARNTGGSEHGIDRRALDGYGYGVPSLTSMLQHDPTKYPDVNPLLRFTTDSHDIPLADILCRGEGDPAWTRVHALATTTPSACAQPDHNYAPNDPPKGALTAYNEDTWYPDHGFDATKLGTSGNPHVEQIADGKPLPVDPNSPEGTKLANEQQAKADAAASKSSKSKTEASSKQGDADADSGSSTGLVVGIVIAALVLLALVGWWLARRRRRGGPHAG